MPKYYEYWFRFLKVIEDFTVYSFGDTMYLLRIKYSLTSRQNINAVYYFVVPICPRIHVQIYLKLSH